MQRDKGVAKGEKRKERSFQWGEKNAVEKRKKKVSVTGERSGPAQTQALATKNETECRLGVVRQEGPRKGGAKYLLSEKKRYRSN